MRILSPHCGVAAESTSGGEAYERELLHRLAGPHYVSLLLTLGARERAPDAMWGGHFVVHTLPISRGLTWWLAPFLLLDRMRDLPRPDLLRVHSLKFIGPSALYARRVFWPGVPLVAHHHHLELGEAHRIERWVSDRMDRVIVGTRFALRQMEQRGWRTDHVRVVPYGVDTERFQPRPAPFVRARCNLAADAKVVLYFGGLKPRKNVGRLLGIWERLAPLVPAAVLVIAGGGPLLDAYRSLVVSRRIPRAHFLGYVPEADKPSVYAMGDVFVFPSWLEGFGLPVLEAMASGLPCVVNDVSDFADWLDPADVLNLDTRDALRADADQRWAFRLARLLRDDTLRAEIGRRNRRMAETMTWDRCVSDTVKVYEEVL